MGDAPPSTKSKEKKRDPQMTQTGKGNQWCFGMKAHTGTDPHRLVVHTVVATTASVHDSTVMDDLLHGEEEDVLQSIFPVGPGRFQSQECDTSRPE